MLGPGHTCMTRVSSDLSRSSLTATSSTRAASHAQLTTAGVDVKTKRPVEGCSMPSSKPPVCQGHSARCAGGGLQHACGCQLKTGCSIQAAREVLEDCGTYRTYTCRAPTADKHRDCPTGMLETRLFSNRTSICLRILAVRQFHVNSLLLQRYDTMFSGGGLIAR